MDEPLGLGAASADAAPSKLSTVAGTWLLSGHVHVCLSGDHAIFLDLRRNLYQAIGHAERNIIQRHVSGWPRDGVEESVSSADARELLILLSSQGLITRDPTTGKTIDFAKAPPPAEVLVDDDPMLRPPMSARDVLRFASCSARPAMALRLCSLERVVNRVRRRKLEALDRGKASTLERDRELVMRFNRLRPFAFSAFSQCLYDSLALIEFLAMHDSFPDWVIGVHTGPFAAHSWVQQHGYLFNGPVDQVARYTPILVV